MSVGAVHTFTSRLFTSSKMVCLKVALIQLEVTPDKPKNIANASQCIKEAKANKAELVILPEIFNSPYATKYFPVYAEEIPGGTTSKCLSKCARENNIHVVGGSIPETEGDKLYNTCTVWNPKGELIAKHRKIHLFDIDIPGKITFKESDALTSGNKATIFEINQFKIGIGICYDIRFAELANIYRNKGCNFLIYPGSFNMTTGPLHWNLLSRARACDNQLYVASVSPARDITAEYVAYGHSLLVNPLGEIELEAREEQTILYGTIDLNKVNEVRQNIPILKQRRTDLYDIVHRPF